MPTKPTETAPLKAEVTGLPVVPELLAIARRVCWWKQPEETLAAPASFLARLMTLGSWDEVRAVRTRIGDLPFRRVLRHPPAGIFDERSWHYWHHALGFRVVPPLPERRIPCGVLLRQSEPNTLTVTVDREGPVKVSFFGGLRLGRVGEPEAAPDTGLLVASRLDLAATKVAVVQQRAEQKDYLDLAALLRAGIGLADMLGAAAALYGAQFNPLISLKALSYFADGDLPGLPNDLKVLLSSEAAAVREIPDIYRRSDKISPGK